MLPSAPSRAPFWAPDGLLRLRPPLAVHPPAGRPRDREVDPPALGRGLRHADPDLSPKLELLLGGPLGRPLHDSKKPAVEVGASLHRLPPGAQWRQDRRSRLGSYSAIPEKGKNAPASEAWPGRLGADERHGNTHPRGARLLIHAHRRVAVAGPGLSRHGRVPWVMFFI